MSFSEGEKKMNQQKISFFFYLELFRPGKLKNRWNPQQQQQQGQDDEAALQIRQKTKLRNVNEILQTNSVTHASYHVPPG